MKIVVQRDIFCKVFIECWFLDILMSSKREKKNFPLFSRIIKDKKENYCLYEQQKFDKVYE